jgi:hypothetical protein
VVAEIFKSIGKIFSVLPMLFLYFASFLLQAWTLAFSPTQAEPTPNEGFKASLSLRKNLKKATLVFIESNIFT